MFLTFVVAALSESSEQAEHWRTCSQFIGQRCADPKNHWIQVECDILTSKGCTGQGLPSPRVGFLAPAGCLNYLAGEQCDLKLTGSAANDDRMIRRVMEYADNDCCHGSFDPPEYAVTDMPSMSAAESTTPEPTSDH